MAKLIFIVACAIAFASPFLGPADREAALSDSGFHGFPEQLGGHRLREVGLTDRERYFLDGFPGQIGRFTDGRREIVIRRVSEATRELHPASDCFRAIGYSVTPLPIRVDEHGKHWSAFKAEKFGEALTVYERIEDKAGRSWTDVSAWYWAVWGNGSGEWWAWTVAERTRP